MTAIEARWHAGVAALAEGAPAEALPLLRDAAAAGAGGGYAALNLGLALEQLGRLAEAIDALEAARVALPDHPEPPFRLGVIAGLRGERERAEGLFRAALERDPAHVTALAGLAALAEEAGRLDAAAAFIAEARISDPTEIELDVVSARLALRRGQATEAATAAEAVLRRCPVHPAAAALFADALLQSEGPAAAQASLSARALADPLGPNWALALARLHGSLGRPKAGLAELRAAETLAPSHPQICAALGLALADCGDRLGAERVLRQAIIACPTVVDLHNRLGAVLFSLHRFADMLAVLDAAVSAFGPEPTLQLNRALALNAMGDQAAALATADSALPASGDSLPALITRISILSYHPEQGTGAKLRDAARAIDARYGPSPPPPRRPADPQRRLRVGILSGGLGQHPVGWLTLAGLEALPETEFELAAYAMKPREDWLAKRYRMRCALWRDVAMADEAATAAMIAADGCDILLDLGGYGDAGRPGVAQRRPAPVQIKWVGAQFSTTGLAAMDWMLTDRWETPPGSEPLYTERLLRLPDGYVCYLPPGYAPAVGPSPAMRNGHVTFGCLNNLAKVTPAGIATWARILAAIPDARLVLRTHALGEDSTRAGMVARLRAAGIAPERVELGGSVPHATLLAAYNEIDIALDPFPYTGGLTVCEALWMGVPVVTLVGDSFCGRHAYSHLANIGLDDWAVTTPEAYVARAVRAAGDVAALAAVRAGLRPRMAASPLVDAPRFGRALGTALRHAWTEWCRGGG